MNSRIRNKSLEIFFLCQCPDAEGTDNILFRGWLDYQRVNEFDYECTKAHELGHGAYRLRHTFSEENRYREEQGKTSNLMDYVPAARAREAEELKKYQWDYIHDPELILFARMEEEEEGETGVYGVKWLGNILWGLYPDAQEREIEKRLELFNEIFKKYDKYFDNSKKKDLYLSLEKYKTWSVRTKSHSEQVAKKIFEGLKEKDKRTFNLWNEGIYLEKYLLEGKTYKVAVYSVKENIKLGENIKISSFSDLRYNRFIKAGYTDGYGLICFYDSEGKMHMVIQVIGKTPETDVKQWLNNLGLILPSKEQEERDKNILSKILDIMLHNIEELNKIWGEENKKDTQKERIEQAIEEMKEYLGNPYKYGGGASRTSLDVKGTAEMDCSEFMSRFIQKACGLEKVPEYTTELMNNWIKNEKFGDDNLEYIDGSKKIDFKDIQPGDVFLWRTESGGHTGVVVSYNSATDLVTVIEAIGESGAREESLSKNLTGYCKGCIRVSVYSRTGKSLATHEGWIGYFRPKIK